MRILSIKQPWATLIVLGHKPVENRTWSTRYRGPLLIHASLKLDPDPKGINLLDQWGGGVTVKDLPTGQIIGIAELYDVTDNSNSTLQLGPTSDWFSGPYGWWLRDARQFEIGIPCKGQLGIPLCPAHIAALIPNGDKK